MPVKKDEDRHMMVTILRGVGAVAAGIAVAAAAVYGYRLSSRRAITAATVTD